MSDNTNTNGNQITSNWKEPAFGDQVWADRSLTRKRIQDLSHQHLSNIYFALATGFVTTVGADVFMRKIASYVTQKFGHLESYKPEYDDEIQFLKDNKFMDSQGHITINGGYQGYSKSGDSSYLPEVVELTNDDIADEFFSNMLAVLNLPISAAEKPEWERVKINLHALVKKLRGPGPAQG